MKLLAIVVLGILGGASAQFSSLPDCGDACASQAAGATGSCNGDLRCLCTNRSFLDAFTNCVYLGCPREDQGASIGRMALVCAAAPQPTTSSTSTTTSAAQTTTSTTSSASSAPVTTSTSTGSQPTTTAAATGSTTTTSRATTTPATTPQGVVGGARTNTQSDSTVVVVQTQVVGGTGGNGAGGVGATGNTVFDNAAPGLRNGGLAGVVGAVLVGVAIGLGV
ncbi:hypothetical protein H1R20_g12166, partial [Candolleomyces eurysporus]